MKRLFLAFVLVLGGFMANTAFAQDAQQAEELTPGQQAEAQLALQTARNLISYGETKGDALALVTAAKLFIDVPGRVLADGEEDGNGNDVDINALLDKAVELAPDSEAIASLAEEVREAAESADRAYCYWRYYCAGGWCQYYWWCVY